MEQELTQKLINAVENIGVDVKTLATKVGKLETTVEKLVIKVVEMDGRMDGLVTKDEFNKKTDELITMIDGFVNKQTTLDHELVSIRSKNERTDERLTVVEHHLGLAT